MLYINMVYTYYIVCVTCVLIEQLVPARPPKQLKRPHTSPNRFRLPLVVHRGCFAAKNITNKCWGSLYLYNTFIESYLIAIPVYTKQFDCRWVKN